MVRRGPALEELRQRDARGAGCSASTATTLSVRLASAKLAASGPTLVRTCSSAKLAPMSWALSHHSSVTESRATVSECTPSLPLPKAASNTWFCT
jgi:hypothetical protein